MVETFYSVIGHVMQPKAARPLCSASHLLEKTVHQNYTCCFYDSVHQVTMMSLVIQVSACLNL